MFRVVGRKIYFKEWEVAQINIWLRETVLQDLVHELENHIPTRDFDNILERVTRIEREMEELNSKEALKDTSW